MTFSEWLLKKIEDSGLSYSEIARRGGISHARISQVVNGARPGSDFCIAIAQAFGEDATHVLRLAGILTALPPAVAEEQEAVRILRSLAPEARAAAMSMLRGLAGKARAVPPEDKEPPGDEDGGGEGDG